MYNFVYEKVNSVEEVEKILNEDVESKILAGGQTLIPTMKQRLASPSTLIDISGIDELKFVKDNDSSIEIGSMTTHYDVSSSDIVLNKLPSLASLVSLNFINFSSSLSICSTVLSKVLPSGDSITMMKTPLSSWGANSFEILL